MSTDRSRRRVWCTASEKWQEYTSLVIRSGRYALVQLAEGNYGLLKGDDQLLPFRFTCLEDDAEALDVLAGITMPRRGKGRRHRPKK
jgi:hypothetical protein